MKIQVVLFVIGLVIVTAQPPTKTRKGLPPARRPVPRRNDIKDVPDNSRGRAPTQVVRVSPLATVVRRGPPPPRYRTAPAPIPAPAPFAPVPLQRVPVPPPQRVPVPPPQGGAVPPPQRVPVPPPQWGAAPPPQRVPVPLTRTKSAGFLSGGVPYVPPANPTYPPTTMPPMPPTTAYIHYDRPDVKQEEEEEG